jgi:hypothetical protein
MVSIPSQDDFKAMVVNAPEGIIVYNSETFLYLNPFACSH